MNDEHKAIRPIVKWAGGKTQILDKLLEYAPKEYGAYFEPFLGGGALLLELAPKTAYINDTNKELMCLYRCVASDKYFEKFISLVDEHTKNHSEDYYYEVRNMDRDKNYVHKPSYVRAARTLYLNKACFNGLYRVNPKNQFNVPWNQKDTVNCYDRENLNAVHEYLLTNAISMTNKSYSAAVKNAKKGDFVYFDPPYDKLEGKESFTSYTKKDFGKKDQERLAKCFKQLDAAGVKVMLSNHNTPLINKLYAGYNIYVIQARRNINSKGDSRGNVEEVIITNY